MVYAFKIAIQLMEGYHSLQLSLKFWLQMGTDWFIAALNRKSNYTSMNLYDRPHVDCFNLINYSHNKLFISNIPENSNIMFHNSIVIADIFCKCMEIQSTNVFRFFGYVILFP